MKKLLILFAFIPLLINAQTGQKAIVELFVYSNIAEYDSILKIMDNGGYDFVAYHHYPSDTLKCKEVVRLMDLRLTYVRPCSYLNGYRIENCDFLNPNIYQQKANQCELYNDDLYAEGKLIRMQPALDLLSVKIRCDNTTGTHMMAMVTESFPNTRYKNVLRKLFIDQLYTGGTLTKIITIEPNWKLENCKLLVIVETTHGQIISCRHEPFVNWFTGIEETALQITAYPNPVQSILTIKSSELLSIIRIINSSGLILDNLTVNDYQYQYHMDDLQAGLYFVQTPIKTFKIVKQ